jgi:hypothetical protein
LAGRAFASLDGLLTSKWISRFEATRASDVKLLLLSGSDKNLLVASVVIL